MRNARLLDNVGEHGGGLHASQAAQLTVMASVLRGNNASISGGGLKLESGVQLVMNDSSLEGNDAGLGGGLFISNSGFSIAESTMRGNWAARGAGAYVLSDYEGITPRIESSTFERNVVTQRSTVLDVMGSVESAEGGALYMYSAGIIEIRGSEFSFNSAESGGAASHRRSAA